MAVLSLGPVALQRAEIAEREGIVGLIRETVDGLRDLIADHIKLARLELVADAKNYGRGVAVLAVAGLVLAIGYVFGLIAGALELALLWGTPLAFAAVAGLNLVVGAVALAWALAKMRRTRLMHDTVAEAKDSINALARPLQGRIS